jgi:D-aminoacyl-tRNA deacylase
MRIVLQRVLEAQCKVDQQVVGSIQKGLLLFVGFSKNDDESLIETMAHRIAHARVFEDAQGKMNLNIQQVQGEILSISQFTLYGDTRKGHRPSFDQAASAQDAQALYEAFNQALNQHVHVEQGQFQAEMHITAVHDGPVTLTYQQEKL